MDDEADDVPTSDILKLSDQQLADLLIRAAALIDLLDSAVGAEAHALLAEARPQLRPLLFTPRLAPRTVVLTALRRLSSRPQQLHRAVRIAFEQIPSTSSAQICVLLELLASSATPDGEMIAFYLVEHDVILAQVEWARGSVEESLVYLASAGGVQAVLSLTERLRRFGALSGKGAMAAVRMIASKQPSQLGLILDDLKFDLAALGHGRLSHLLADAARRAGPQVLLATLVSLPFAEHKALLRAAFSPPNASFGFERELHLLGQRDTMLVVSMLEDRVYRAEAASVSSVPLWHREVCAVAGIQPTQAIQMRAWPTPDAADEAPDRGPGVTETVLSAMKVFDVRPGGASLH